MGKDIWVVDMCHYESVSDLTIDSLKQKKTLTVQLAGHRCIMHSKR
jgi:hypothetical protein